MKPSNYDKRLYAIDDYEKLAKTRFFKHADDYFNSGADAELSLNEQYEAFRDYKIMQRCNTDVSNFKGT